MISLFHSCGKNAYNIENVKIEIGGEKMDEQDPRISTIVNLYVSGLSIRRVAEQVSLSSGTVAYYLNKLNITRSPEQAAKIKDLSKIQNHIDISKELYEVLTGEMLGDGCLKCTGKSAYFSYGTSNIVYRDYLMNRLKDLGLEIGDTWHYTNTRSDEYQLYGFYTKSYVELMDIYNQWYTNEPKKKILAQVELTPTIVKHWYVGDGTLDHDKLKDTYRIYIFTCIFSQEENQLLADKLSLIGMPTRVGHVRHYPCLRISSMATFEFLNYIGEPVPGYEYKWIGGTKS